MKRRWLLVLLILIGLFTLPTTFGPRRQVQPGQRLMREKSVVSQRLFTAIVREDFSLVSTQAQKLAILAQSAYWPRVVATNAELLEEREQLRRGAEALSQVAANSNGETLQNSFTALTRDCVQCHRQIQLSKRVL